MAKWFPKQLVGPFERKGFERPAYAEQLTLDGYYRSGSASASFSRKPMILPKSGACGGRAAGGSSLRLGPLVD
jgi:hypothetical protein